MENLQVVSESPKSELEEIDDFIRANNARIFNELSEYEEGKRTVNSEVQNWITDMERLRDDSKR